MNDLKEDMYDHVFRLWNMVPMNPLAGYGPAGNLYQFSNNCGRGEYWVYFRGNLFAVNAFDMRFFHEGVMRFQHTEHLIVGYYEQADLVQQTGGLAPRAGGISTYLAEEGAEYVAHYQAGSHMRATSITISPDYYRTYLQARFGDIPNVRRAFQLVDGRQDFPELASLLKQVRSYRGEGMAADLFYEGAVAEALALIIKRASDIEIGQTTDPSTKLSLEDRTELDKLYAFIRNNPGANLSCEELAHRACMGQTKLKAAFKTAFGTSPATLVAHVRMERAEELLSTTDLPVAHVARAVGYRKPGAFTEAFCRHVGVTPTAYRGK